MKNLVAMFPNTYHKGLAISWLVIAIIYLNKYD